MGLRDYCAPALLVALILGGIACVATEGPPLPQLVVVIDTDLPIAGQITPMGLLSDDAAIDSLSIEVLDSILDSAKDGKPPPSINLVSPDVKDWPVSFGIKSGAAAGSILRLRIRAFRGRLAKPGTSNGVDTLEPPAQITVSRLVKVRLPTEGKTTVAITLQGDCIGIPPSISAGTTCVDGDHLHAPAAEGVTVVADARAVTTKAGTWKPAIETQCAEASTDTRKCIPGGFTLLGDDALKGFADGIEFTVDPTPLRPVELLPFYLDRDEFTVGDLEGLLKSKPGAITEAMPDPYSPDPGSGFHFCTWKKGDDTLPLNCMSWQLALQVCALRGGSLPTEAQWEHAARGRGQHRDFPWASGEISCCRASVARQYLQGVKASCAGFGVQPVGTHVCEGGDVSRDRVRDLAGGLRERVQGQLVPYDRPCWGPEGVLFEPLCDDDPSTNTLVTRGGSWKRPYDFALSALRGTDVLIDVSSNEIGFRCAY